MLSPIPVFYFGIFSFLVLL